MFDFVSKFEFEKSLFLHVFVFLFPVLIGTVHHGGAASYLFLFLIGLVLGWSAWSSLKLWEKKLLLGFVVFFVLISVSLINTEDLRDGFKKIERYIHFPLLIPMYLLLKKYHIETGKTFLYGLIVASLVMCLQAFYQLFVLDFYRPAGAYNAIVLGDISMLFAMIILGALVVMPYSRLKTLLGVIAVSLALSVSFVSGSRGGWVLLPVVVFGLLWLHRKKLKRSSFSIIIVFVFVFFFGLLQIDYISSRVSHTISVYQNYTKNADRQDSVGQRMDMWSDAVSIWKKSPVIGTGIGDYKKSRLELYAEGELKENVQYGHAHSIYFDVLATAGTVGFLSMVIFVLILPFRMFYSFWQTERDSWLRFYALSGMITILAFAIFGLTEAWLARNPFVRTYLMCVLVFMSSIAVRKASLSASVADASSKEQA